MHLREFRNKNFTFMKIWKATSQQIRVNDELLQIIFDMKEIPEQSSGPFKMLVDGQSPV